MEGSGDALIVALYKFVKVDEPEVLKRDLEELTGKYGIKGMLLVASEGLNGTISGTEGSLRRMLSDLKEDERFKDIEWKEARGQRPFLRMRVRLKQEIVALGVPGVDPTQCVGTYVEPKDWNSIISDPNVTVIDTRNDYEVGVGTFKGAIDPKTATFKEFPRFCETLDKSKQVAMFCTGGIRCEKASSYLLQQGFDTVYHLKGGILKYLEEVPEGDSMWEGECFVFDDRVGVRHGLAVGDLRLCRACRYPLTAAERQLPSYKEGVSCEHCKDKLTDAQKQRHAERDKQVKLAEKRNVPHLGTEAGKHAKRPKPIKKKEVTDEVNEHAATEEAVTVA
eukprot:TRINITY_DN35364_c0_g1_i1.p1 TRINITY_DN35364_c0_g1~~TRINITY_DN35364_c0_g1_i1.p1  ORF type:complete len:346 (+),score=124.19 TRINITY_DN35364_c0_g1_i1:32-1039(+)